MAYTPPLYDSVDLSFRDSTTVPVDMGYALTVRVVDSSRSPLARSYRAYLRSDGSTITTGVSNASTGLFTINVHPSYEMDIQIFGQGTEPDVFIRKVTTT